jgi:hypothetical protein
MVEIVSAAISRPASARLVVIAAVAAASLVLPPVGVPMALGVAGYLTIALSKPNCVVRGRILSAAQHRRTALAVGSGVFGIAALFSATLTGLGLATRLEAQLYDRIEVAAGAGSLKLGDTLQQCESFACAQATIVRLATFRTLGLVQLRGFALDDVHAYAWRQPMGRLFENRPGGALGAN